MPDRLASGIRLEHVSFAYPGTERLVLDDVDLDLPAGAVVAVVGENGAGKSTLVKLLCRLYEPTTGAILVDGVDLARMPRRRRGGRGWPAPSRTSSGSSCPPGQTVGVGDLPRLDDEPAVAHGGGPGRGRRRGRPAGGRASTPSSGRPGPTASRCRFGQWQKLALARGFMRDEPLLLVLDEPTAALDAETEHALFERYAAAARPARRDDGRITVLVSHRFSTVRMADLIVVLDGPAWSRSAPTTTSWPAAASTPSSTASRPPPTAERGGAGANAGCPGHPR